MIARHASCLLSNGGDGATAVEGTVLNAAGVLAPDDLEEAFVAPAETPAVGHDPVPAARLKAGMQKGRGRGQSCGKHGGEGT